MHLELSIEEATLLATQLSRRVADLDDELVHTDKHQLQHALNLDIQKLKVIEARLAALVASSG